MTEPKEPFLNNQGLLIEVFDHRDINKEKIENIKRFIKNTKGFLIIIDNADIVLDNELREMIYEDNHNQYLIIGRGFLVQKTIKSTLSKFIRLISLGLKGLRTSTKPLR